MIHRLAEIALGIRKCLSRLAHHQRHEVRPVCLEQIGGAVEQRCARGAADTIPFVTGSLGCVQRPSDGF